MLRNDSYLNIPQTELLGICCEGKGLISHQAVHTPELVAITPRDAAPGRPEPLRRDPRPVDGELPPGEGKQRLGLPRDGNERSCCLPRPQACADVVEVSHGHP